MQAAHPYQPPTGADPVAVRTGLMEILDEDQCWALLASVEVGRLAVAVAGDVDIYPVNFILDGRDLVFRTAEGTKLLEVALADRVAFEVDGYEPEHGRAWSVIVKGRAQDLDTFEEIYQAEGLPLFPWNAAPKGRFVRIVPGAVTGRRFTVAQTRSGDIPRL
jgi:hypothetical protein